MAGRMGGVRRTTQNLTVVRIDTALDLIYVKGCVPGIDDAHVLIRDAKKKMTHIAQVNHAKGEFDNMGLTHCAEKRNVREEKKARRQKRTPRLYVDGRI